MATLRTIEPEEPGEDVVETLEYLLAKARAGEISSVAVAVVYRSGIPGATWSRLPSLVAALGAVSRLAHRLNGIADEGME